VSISQGTSYYVGIGCFYFSAEPDKLNTWAADVETHLEQLALISDIRVEGNGGDGSVLIGERAVPIRGAVSFKIVIPWEVQADFMGPLSIDLSIETFRVFITYDRHGPVAFVVTEAAADPLVSPSDHVLVVHEYLTSRLPEAVGGVTFEILEPSPFHANVTLAIGRQKKQFSFRRTPNPRYEDFAFTAASDLYSDIDEALLGLIYHLTEQLALFYRFVVAYNRRLHASAEINHLTQNLLSLYQSSGVRAWLARIFTSTAKMRYLALRAIAEQYESESEATRSRSEIDGIYSSGTEPCFKDYLVNKMSENFSDNLSAAREISALLDQARGRQIENVSLFLSALVGGLAGALVSLLVH
jgi:hypothetical protein